MTASSPPEYHVIADPASRRWVEYQTALSQFWERRGQTPQVVIYPWQQIIGNRGKLDASIESRGILRIESPGRDFQVNRQLIQLGAELDRTSVPDLSEAKGRLIHPRFQHEGLAHTLHQLGDQLSKFPGLYVSRDPVEAAAMFDKNATSRRLADAGISVPRPMMPNFGLKDADTLLQTIAAQSASGKRWKQTYIKLNHGSSGSGIIALSFNQRGEPIGVSTMVELDGEFYNTRKLQDLRGDLLRRAIQFVLDHGACVQEGIPKARVDGCSFDIRAVVLYGKVEFTVFRLSRSPFTNLHLGGTRGNWQRCREQIPNRVWLDAMNACEEAAKLYNAEMLGVDLAFDSAICNYFIFELNAFGDFVPGWTNASGQSIHDREIELTCQKFRQCASS